mmetsp:Transcript_9490/g.18953  ORF Transcript_9490/g.18953 Transcript_9490/m.18953 type:complete len:204 (-) Transcript_9490:636-1247(-)
MILLRSMTFGSLTLIRSTPPAAGKTVSFTPAAPLLCAGCSSTFRATAQARASGPRWRRSTSSQRGCCTLRTVRASASARRRSSRRRSSTTCMSSSCTTPSTSGARRRARGCSRRLRGAPPPSSSRAPTSSGRLPTALSSVSPSREDLPAKAAPRCSPPCSASARGCTSATTCRWWRESMSSLSRLGAAARTSRTSLGATRVPR